MKKLLVLVFLASIGLNAQTLTGDSELVFSDVEFSTKPFTTINSGSLNSRDPMYHYATEPVVYEIVTLKDYLDYQTHCKNDSTLVDVYYDPNTTTKIGNVNFTTSMAGYWYKEWQGKNPTFEGFINYLKTKK